MQQKVAACIDRRVRRFRVQKHKDKTNFRKSQVRERFVLVAKMQPWEFTMQAGAQNSLFVYYYDY
jgi:hypothetical protein